MPCAYVIVDMKISDAESCQHTLAVAPAAANARAHRVGATEFFNMVVVEGVDAPV
jgi:uncharacterized protein (DUF1330 family)